MILHPHPIAYLIGMIGSLLESIIGLYTGFLLVYIILQWLVQLQIVSLYRPLFRGITFARIINFLARWYEPMLTRIRHKIPGFGGIDFSPIVLFFLLQFIGYTVGYVFDRLAMLVQGLLA